MKSKILLAEYVPGIAAVVSKEKITSTTSDNAYCHAGDIRWWIYPTTSRQQCAKHRPINFVDTIQFRHTTWERVMATLTLGEAMARTTHLHMHGRARSIIMCLTAYGINQSDVYARGEMARYVGVMAATHIQSSGLKGHGMKAIVNNIYSSAIFFMH